MEGMPEIMKGDALEGVEVQFTKCLHFRFSTGIQRTS